MILTNPYITYIENPTESLWKSSFGSLQRDILTSCVKALSPESTIGGVVLYGPPGFGKSVLLKLIRSVLTATDPDVLFVEVKATTYGDFSDIWREWAYAVIDAIGEARKNGRHDEKLAEFAAVLLTASEQNSNSCYNALLNSFSPNRKIIFVIDRLQDLDSTTTAHTARDIHNFLFQLRTLLEHDYCLLAASSIPASQLEYSVTTGLTTGSILSTLIKEYPMITPDCGAALIKRYTKGLRDFTDPVSADSTNELAESIFAKTGSILSLANIICLRLYEMWSEHPPATPAEIRAAVQEIVNSESFIKEANMYTLRLGRWFLRTALQQPALNLINSPDREASAIPKSLNAYGIFSRDVLLAAFPPDLLQGSLVFHLPTGELHEPDRYFVVELNTMQIVSTVFPILGQLKSDCFPHLLNDRKALAQAIEAEINASPSARELHLSAAVRPARSQIDADYLARYFIRHESTPLWEDSWHRSAISLFSLDFLADLILQHADCFRPYFRGMDIQDAADKLKTLYQYRQCFTHADPSQRRNSDGTMAIPAEVKLRFEKIVDQLLAATNHVRFHAQ